MSAKAKRAIIPPQRGWMHRRWYAVLLGVVFLFNGLLYVHEVPSQQQDRRLYIQYNRTVGLVSGVPLQFATVLFHFILMPQDETVYVIPTSQAKLEFSCIIILASVVLVLFLSWLQQFRRFFRWLVYGMYAPSLLLIPLALQSPSYVIMPPVGIVCTATVSPAIQLQGIYPLKQGANYVPVSMTRDGGQTWHEVFRIFDSDSFSTGAACLNSSQWANVGSYDDQLFWYLGGTSFLTHAENLHFIVSTRDSGKTWTIWHLNQAIYKFIDAGCSIQEVSFTDHLRGEMQVPCRSRDIVLYTADGGIHWQIAEE